MRISIPLVDCDSGINCRINEIFSFYVCLVDTFNANEFDKVFRSGVYV